MSEDWKARAEAAEARCHDLSVKYTCALHRLREMGEALRRIAAHQYGLDQSVTDEERADYWAGQTSRARSIARAALASQPDNRYRELEGELERKTEVLKAIDAAPYVTDEHYRMVREALASQAK